MHFSRILSLFVLSLPLSAQTTVLASTTTRSVSIGRPYLHNIATAGDGSMWTAVVHSDGQSNTSDFALVQSTDGGKTWKGLYYYPTTNQIALGAIYIGGDCRTLHAVWTDGLNDGFLHLHYQTFDTSTQKWIGSPVVIQGATSTIKWYPHDIQITPKGTLIVGASSGAGGGPNFSGQSTILFIRKLGEAKFSAPIQVNKSTTLIVDIGRAPSLHVEGEVVHIIYRTKRSGNSGLHFGFSYRAYDTAANTFLHASDVHIGPNDNNGVNGGLNLATALDGSGNLYCVYVSPNTLRMAYGAKGKTGTNAGWQDITITADNGLLGGNSPTNAYAHFGIANGPGDDVHVIYSKLSEQHQNLYIQTFRQGLPLLRPPLKNERVLKSTSAANSFLEVNGDTNVRKVSGPMAIVAGTPSTNTNGIAWFFDINADPSRTVQLGVACSGNLGTSPGLRSTNQPQIGKQFTLRWDNLPQTSPFFLALDTSCLATPFDMGALGAPSCFLYGALAIPVGPFPAQASGTLQLSATLPNDNRLLGTGLLLQSVVLAKGANAVGLLATNALGVFF